MRRLQGGGDSSPRRTGAISCRVCGVAAIFIPGGGTMAVAQIDRMGCRCLYWDTRTKNVRTIQPPITAT